jgi:hypothetical protein
MQDLFSLVTLPHVHDFIFKKQPLIKPCKILLKQNTQKKEGKKKNNQLAKEKKEQLAINI